MNVSQTARTFWDSIFGSDYEAYSPYPTILEGDKFYSESIEYTVEAIVENSPFVVAPEEWAAWGNSGCWCYVVARDLALEAIPAKQRPAVSCSFAEYVPYDFLVMLALEA